MTAPDPIRCSWAEGASDLMRRYHDEEWGVPQHDDRRLFELLTLEGAQAGLSWETILRKREGYRAAFAGFHYAQVAGFGEADVARLLADPAIVRNRLKIASTITNANALLAVRAEFGSFDAYIWRFVEPEPLLGHPELVEGPEPGSPEPGRRVEGPPAPLRHAFISLSELPAKTPESEAMSKDLRRRGFAFVGPTVCYALMQAAGLVNDHVVGCFRYAEVGVRAVS